jgi:hypothetical protein
MMEQSGVLAPVNRARIRELVREFNRCADDKTRVFADPHVDLAEIDRLDDEQLGIAYRLTGILMGCGLADR